jgi:RNA ligase
VRTDRVAHDRRSVDRQGERRQGGLMKLYDLLNHGVLDNNCAKGLINVQNHPTLPLQIFNYSQKAQFEGDWNDGVLPYCRGLIVDHQENIISRGFKKFWNLNTPSVPETLEANLPKTTPTILEKYDGSLGILWRYRNEYGIATRGSFTSPQAQWATKWFKDWVDPLVFGCLFLALDYNWTHLFEIIYSENRIVVQYPWEGLVSLGFVNNETGEEMAYDIAQRTTESQGFRTARRITDRSVLECMKDNNPNEEGYVVSYERPGRDPLKVKIKMADYVRLHKIVTGMNPRSIWAMLSTGKDFMQFESMPEQFQQWLKRWVKELRTQYDSVFFACRELYEECPALNFEVEPYRDYRKRFALHIQKEALKEYHSVLFAMLDKRDVSPIIWKMIKPRGDDQSFRTEGE